MERKHYKILIVFVVVVLVIKLVSPIIEEYGAKGKREPLYVRKYYKSKVDDLLRSKRGKLTLSNDLEEKYSLNDIYIHPYIFSSTYGEQIEKSYSGPYDFNIFAETTTENRKVVVSNVRVVEKIFFFLKREIFFLKDGKELLINSSISKGYSRHYEYSKDLSVSQIYMKTLIVTFDVSTEIDGKIVTKSMEYIMEPVIEKGIQKPIWMYQ